ncbi:hypothetical protein [Streptomyces sp. 147326]|uniref:hypothetical protein n=1 Tax=Streptomyces sp. 147326 TaxID=3074379 RepID=UPI0038573E40
MRPGPEAASRVRRRIVELYASQPVQDEVRRTSNGTAHHVELPAAELQAEVARIQKQLKR